MSDSMGSEFSPQQRQEVPTANLLEAGDIAVSNRLSNLKRLKRFAAPAIIGASVVPLLLSAGCGNIPNPFAKERIPTPTPTMQPIDMSKFTLRAPTPVPTATPKPTETPRPTATITPEPTPTPTPTIQATETATPKVEIQQPKVISMGGTVEPDPANQSAGEMIKLLFPKGTVDGESPLIPKGDTLSLSFKLNSVKGIGIRECSLSISDLLGIKNKKSSIAINPTNASATADIASSIRAFQRIAQFSVSDDQKIIEKITFTCLRNSNEEGIAVKLTLPNEPFTYTDKDGSHLVNPAERYVSGKVGLGINRGNIAFGRFPLTAEDINIKNGEGKLVATADRFDIPTRTPVPTRPPEATQVPVTHPLPTIQPTKAPTPKPKEEENKWTRKWAPNETLPIREWWDDMVAKGYISIDAIAQQYAGEQINSFLNANNLVPNPVKYYLQGHGFINDCNLELDKLVKQGQGHIKITQDAYAQIPGGVGCQIFNKGK